MTLKLKVAVCVLVAAIALSWSAMCPAQDCGSWRYGSVGPSGDAVALGGGRTIVLDYLRDRVFVSEHEGSWSWAAAPFGSATGVAWGAGVFVVVGAKGIWDSEDGLSWRQVASPQAGLTDVAWNGSQFTAVGTLGDTGPGVVMTSPDGVGWTTTDLPSAVSLETIIWGGSQWLGAGQGLFTSSDGTTWTQRATGHFTAVGWNGSAYLAMGLGDDGHPVTATSTDAVQWTVRPHSTYGPGHLASDGRTWVVPALFGVETSTDGVTWTYEPFQAYLSPETIVWTGTEFLAVGPSGTAESSDGIIWSIHPLVDFLAATWAGDHFVALGVEKGTGIGVAYTSPDGASWSEATLPPEGIVGSVVWTGSQLVAVGPGGGVYTSPTGDVWTKQSVPSSVATANLGSVAWNGSTLVAVGDEAVLLSTDGVAWTAVAPPAESLSSVTWGNGVFVATGGDFVFTSADGQSWASQRAVGPFEGEITGETSAGLVGIAWNGTRFVAVGSVRYPHQTTLNPIVATSVDGTSWSPVDMSAFAGSGFSKVTWTGMGFYATSNLGLFMSLDGTSWARDLQTDWFMLAVAGNGRQLVALGSSDDADQLDCTAPPPIGQSGVSNVTIAAAAHVSGLAGTQWTTDVELYNPDSSTTAAAVLYFLPRDTDNTIATRRGVSVPAGHAVRLADVVGQLFGLSQSAGALIVSSSQQLIVTSSTSTSSSSGTLGQFIPGQPESAALLTGQEGRLIQLSQNASYRTNIGFASLSDVPTTVTVTLHKATGEPLGSMPVELPPFGSTQVTQILAQLGASSVDDAYAVVRSDTSRAEYFAYASVVDNVSGDPLTVLPVQASTSDPLYLPAVAHNPGLNGTMWRTDLEVHNPGTVQASYRVELLKTGQDNSTPPSATFLLDPGTSYRYLDVVGSVFGFSGSGALRVTPLAGAVAACARTYTDSGTGSRGQFITAVPLSQASSTITGARLIELSHSADRASGFRTNIGFVNASALPITVKADLYTAAGTWLGASVNTLAPCEFNQVTGILGTVTPIGVADGFAVVTSSTPDAHFFAYASVIDNLSGGGVYVPGQ